MRFASENGVLGQFEVGVGTVPGGGPMARLGRLVGRGRALEILLGGDDIPAGVAAEYGYVNRLIPDAEIEGFTDAFARRIAAFDKVAVAGIKKLVDATTLPDDDKFAPGLAAYFATAGRPENRRSSNCYSRTASSNPTALRPTSAPPSERCDRTGSRRTKPTAPHGPACPVQADAARVAAHSPRSQWTRCKPGQPRGVYGCDVQPTASVSIGTCQAR